jgi:hypothetical protein
LFHGERFNAHGVGDSALVPSDVRVRSWCVWLRAYCMFVLSTISHAMNVVVG